MVFLRFLRTKSSHFIFTEFFQLKMIYSHEIEVVLITSYNNKVQGRRTDHVNERGAVGSVL